MSQSQKKDNIQAEVPKDDKKKEEVKGKAGKDGKRDSKGNKEEELSEEDQQLKEKMELLNERLRDVDPAQRFFALTEIKKEVAGATQSMTSVPKPLKFLSQHYKGMKDYYNTLAPSDFKL